MSYPKSTYQQVFQQVEKITKRPYPPRGSYIQAMVSLKRIFDDNFTIRDIFSAMPSAANKKLWPLGTGLWRRVHDTLLLRQRERREASPVRIDTGMTAIGSLFKLQ